MVSKSIVSCGVVLSAFCAWVGSPSQAEAGCFGRCGGCGSGCGSYYTASYGYTPGWYQGSSCGGGCGSYGGGCGWGRSCGWGGGCGGCGAATCSTGYYGYSGAYCANYCAPYYYALPAYGYPLSADPYYGSFFTS